MCKDRCACPFVNCHPLLKNDMRNLIAVIGNTGVGKSQLGVELARALGGEIINADVMQMYQGLDIVTNKHPLPAREGINHHLLDFLRWDQTYTIHDFEHDALSTIGDLQNRKIIPIVVGGTHYYIQHLLCDKSLITGVSESENNLTEEQLLNLENPAKVEAILEKVDPVILSKFHPNDTRRLRRALEIYYTTGNLPSAIYRKQESGDVQLRFRVLVFWIFCDRERLKLRLDSRVDKMIAEGLLDELRRMFVSYKQAKPADLSQHSGVWQVLGFKQFLPVLEGHGEEFKSCLDAMKADTRQYAKRQTKWILNKFIPQLEKLGGTLAVLDSTNLECWNQEVRDRAICIAKDWLLGKNPVFELVPRYVKAVRTLEMFDTAQWIRRRCDICSAKKHRDIILVGNAAWKNHTDSKSHKKAVTSLMIRTNQNS